MKANFLRPPDGALEWAADGLRVVALLSVAVAAIWFEPTDAGVVAFALPAVVAPRFLGMRAGADLVCQAIVLVAAWSNVFDLYRSVAWWDLVVHFACTGVLAIVLYLLLSRVSIVPVGPRLSAAVVLATAFGLALSALWEIVEWAGWRFISSDIYVAYEDSIGDMAVGAAGALVAGILLARTRLLRPDAR